MRKMFLVGHATSTKHVEAAVLLMRRSECFTHQACFAIGHGSSVIDMLKCNSEGITSMAGPAEQS